MHEDIAVLCNRLKKSRKKGSKTRTLKLIGPKKMIGPQTQKKEEKKVDWALIGPGVSQASKPITQLDRSAKTLSRLSIVVFLLNLIFPPREKPAEARGRATTMKFKAFLTDNGVALLEKRFLPALDKIDRTCHLYLTRDHAAFLHNLLNGDGLQSVAQFRIEALFDAYRISSQNDDRIAFAVDLSLLHRAIRSSVGICNELAADAGGSASDRLQIKLVKKLPANSTQPMPFLTFETKGYKSAVIQDVPISKPMSRAQVSELQSALDSAQALPRTLVQVHDLNQLQSFVDRMRHVGDVLNVSISKHGDLHLQIATTLITLGAEFRKLPILGERADAPPEDRGLSAQARSERAVSRGDAEAVQVSVKHFAKSLQCHTARPDCAFYGIAEQGACLTVIFQFFIPGTRQTDKSISLYCRLPVLDPGTN